MSDIDPPQCPTGPTSQQLSDDPYTIAAMDDLRRKIWATRDACFGHYPMACPLCCANAGKHDDSIGDLCECRECHD